MEALFKKLGTEKTKSLEAALKEIKKNCGGDGAVLTLAQAPAAVPCVSSGSPASTSRWASVAARGRIIEIDGPESSGKTTLMLHAIAEVQRAGCTAAFIDAEHALDPTYAKKLGCNTSSCSCRSRTTATRRSRSSTCSCARTRWTS